MKLFYLVMLVVVPVLPQIVAMLLEEKQDTTVEQE